MHIVSTKTVGTDKDQYLIQVDHALAAKYVLGYVPSGNG